MKVLMADAVPATWLIRAVAHVLGVSRACADER